MACDAKQQNTTTPPRTTQVQETENDQNNNDVKQVEQKPAPTMSRLTVPPPRTVAAMSANDVRHHLYRDGHLRAIMLPRPQTSDFNENENEKDQNNNNNNNSNHVCLPEAFYLHGVDGPALVDFEQSDLVTFFGLRRLGTAKTIMRHLRDFIRNYDDNVAAENSSDLHNSDFVVPLSAETKREQREEQPQTTSYSVANALSSPKHHQKQQRPSSAMARLQREDGKTNASPLSSAAPMMPQTRPTSAAVENARAAAAKAAKSAWAAEEQDQDQDQEQRTTQNQKQKTNHSLQNDTTSTSSNNVLFQDAVSKHHPQYRRPTSACELLVSRAKKQREQNSNINKNDTSVSSSMNSSSMAAFYLRPKSAMTTTTTDYRIGDHSSSGSKYYDDYMAQHRGQTTSKTTTSRKQQSSSQDQSRTTTTSTVVMSDATAKIYMNAIETVKQDKQREAAEDAAGQAKIDKARREETKNKNENKKQDPKDDDEDDLIFEDDDDDDEGLDNQTHNDAFLDKKFKADSKQDSKQQETEEVLPSKTKTTTTPLQQPSALRPQTAPTLRSTPSTTASASTPNSIDVQHQAGMRIISAKNNNKGTNATTISSSKRHTAAAEAQMHMFGASRPLLNHENMRPKTASSASSSAIDWSTVPSDTLAVTKYDDAEESAARRTWFKQHAQDYGITAANEHEPNNMTSSSATSSPNKKKQQSSYFSSAAGLYRQGRHYAHHVRIEQRRLESQEERERQIVLGLRQRDQADDEEPNTTPADIEKENNERDVDAFVPGMLESERRRDEANKLHMALLKGCPSGVTVGWLATNLATFFGWPDEDFSAEIEQANDDDEESSQTHNTNTNNNDTSITDAVKPPTTDALLHALYRQMKTMRIAAKQQALWSERRKSSLAGLIASRPQSNDNTNNDNGGGEDTIIQHDETDSDVDRSDETDNSDLDEHQRERAFRARRLARRAATVLTADEFRVLLLEALNHEEAPTADALFAFLNSRYGKSHLEMMRRREAASAIFRDLDTVLARGFLDGDELQQVFDRYNLEARRVVDEGDTNEEEQSSVTKKEKELNSTSQNTLNDSDTITRKKSVCLVLPEALQEEEERDDTATGGVATTTSENKSNNNKSTKTKIKRKSTSFAASVVGPNPPQVKLALDDDGTVCSFATARRRRRLSRAAMSDARSSVAFRSALSSFSPKTTDGSGNNASADSTSTSPFAALPASQQQQQQQQPIQEPSAANTKVDSDDFASLILDLFPVPGRSKTASVLSSSIAAASSASPMSAASGSLFASPSRSSRSNRQHQDRTPSMRSPSPKNSSFVGLSASFSSATTMSFATTTAAGSAGGGGSGGSALPSVSPDDFDDALLVLRRVAAVYVAQQLGYADTQLTKEDLLSLWLPKLAKTAMGTVEAATHEGVGLRDVRVVSDSTNTTTAITETTNVPSKLSITFAGVLGDVSGIVRDAFEDTKKQQQRNKKHNHNHVENGDDANDQQSSFTLMSFHVASEETEQRALDAVREQMRSGGWALLSFPLDSAPATSADVRVHPRLSKYVAKELPDAALSAGREQAFRDRERRRLFGDDEVEEEEEETNEVDANESTAFTANETQQTNTLAGTRVSEYTGLTYTDSMSRFLRRIGILLSTASRKQGPKIKTDIGTKDVEDNDEDDLGDESSRVEKKTKITIDTIHPRFRLFVHCPIDADVDAGGSALPAIFRSTTLIVPLLGYRHHHQQQTSQTSKLEQSKQSATPPEKTVVVEKDEATKTTKTTPKKSSDTEYQSVDVTPISASRIQRPGRSASRLQRALDAAERDDFFEHFHPNETNCHSAKPTHTIRQSDREDDRRRQQTTNDETRQHAATHGKFAATLAKEELLREIEALERESAAAEAVSSAIEEAVSNLCLDGDVVDDATDADRDRKLLEGATHQQRHNA